MATFNHTSWTNVCDCGSQDNTIRFTAEAKGGPERLWFDFELDCQSDSSSELILELHHGNTLLGGSCSSGLRPVWQPDQDDWQRLPAPDCTEHDDGRFIWRWSLPMPKQRARIATCFPYQRHELNTFLDSTQILRCDEVGVSASGRAMPRILNQEPRIGSERAGVFVTARQHAGESPGSWVLEGLLAAFDQARPDDPLIWALPFVDLDGVEEGRYGKNHYPLDHNRSWYGGGLCHETRLAMHEAGLWSQRCTPTLYLDLHAPGLLEENCYFFTGTEAAQQPLSTFLTIAQEHCGNFASDRFIRQSSYQINLCRAVGIPHSHSGNIYFAERFGCASTTMECTYQSFHGQPATRDDYRQLGQQLAQAVRAYCTVSSPIQSGS